MTQVISINNFKGGVSKTSSTAGIGYVLSELMNKKVLVVDLDPQADVTDILLKTYNNNSNYINDVIHADDLDELFEKEADKILDSLLQQSRGNNNKDLYHTLKDKDSLNETIIELSDNLSLVPSDFNMIGFPYLLESYHLSRIEGAKIFNNFLKEVKNDYDYILIDTPPTLSDFSNNGLYACDYSLIVVQTHIRSFNAVEKLINHLINFQESIDKEFDIVGLLPVMFKNKGRIDEFVMKLMKSHYGDLTFENTIKQRERVKSWDVTGITNDDMHDKNALKMYENITKEILERIGEQYE